jgi:hypothetical protein
MMIDGVSEKRRKTKSPIGMSLKMMVEMIERAVNTAALVMFLIVNVFFINAASR